ncbi:MAG: FliM/FliN family flagellar motor switch protein [Pirellulaceae bacterium]|nr:FliM/FliN family flagellar motor switch protein [Pirellulaceae bacterium]
MSQPQLLKPYCQSVLQVHVPVVVTLAKKSIQIDQLLKLVPGEMIQFEKPYDSPMSVEVVDQPIAEGDIVKAGEKFGIRITQIVSPKERFISLTSRPQVAKPECG